MANGHKNYLAPDVVRTLERDLMPLAAYCASQGDGVVVDDALLAACRRFYETRCPEVSFYSLQSLPSSFRLQPWGWDERLLWTFQKAGASVLTPIPADFQTSDTEVIASPSETAEKRSEEIQKDSDVVQTTSDVVSRLSEVVPNLSDVVFSTSVRKDGISDSGRKTLPSGRCASAQAASTSGTGLHVGVAEVRHLASRRISSDILNRLVRLLPGLPLCGESVYCSTLSAAAEAVARMPRAIIKSPWSSSGRGLRFAGRRLEPPLSGWCRHVIETQGGVVVQPFYDKLFDFAAEFEAEPSGFVRFVAFSLFRTTERCSYVGNAVASQVRLLQDIFGRYEEEIFNLMLPHLQGLLSESLKGRYVGPLGVDMMLCRVEGERFPRLHPCVEINLRRTMGIVAAHLSRLLPYGDEAQFFIRFEHRPEDLRRFAEHRPASVFDDKGRLTGGSLLLTPILPATQYAAFLEKGV